MRFDLKTPCKECPFRHDVKGYITPERAQEICDCLLSGQTFACHKSTVSVEDEEGNGDRVETPNTQHCAGAMIFLEKQNMPNQMMRISERLGFYDHKKLDMDAPVFDEDYEMVEHMERARI